MVLRVAVRGVRVRPAQQRQRPLPGVREAVVEDVTAPAFFPGEPRRREDLKETTKKRMNCFLFFFVTMFVSSRLRGSL